MRNDNVSRFTYRLIGKHVGLFPGDYTCELIKQEVKHNRKGLLETIVTLKVLRKVKKES